jgi:hypothetical protein
VPAASSSSSRRGRLWADLELALRWLAAAAGQQEAAASVFQQQQQRRHWHLVRHLAAAGWEG